MKAPLSQWTFGTATSGSNTAAATTPAAVRQDAGIFPSSDSIRLCGRTPRPSEHSCCPPPALRPFWFASAPPAVVPIPLT